MEEDINIYADLPSFQLTEFNINNDQPKDDHVFEELEKKLNLLTSEIESMKKVNKNLEKNLASLLKTAKAEITRKDKMIEELRNQLDNAAFRRNRNGYLGFSTLRSSYHHDTMAEKYENVTPFMNSEEDASISSIQQIESNYTEYKSRKPQNNISQVPVTVFGERLHKKMMDDKKEEKRLIASETSVNKIPEECIIESDKENGSQSNINNNANESNTVIRNSNLDTSYKKNLGKRVNEENDTYKNKRLKTEDNEDKKDGDIDCNSMMQYDTKDDFAKLEDQLCVMYSIKKEQVPLETKRRASSEYEDTKQMQNCRNGWRNEERISVTRDYDDRRTRKGSVDSSSRDRTSKERLNNDHDHYNNGYRRTDYRHDSRSSSSRSFSKSRNDYESSSSHRLWEKSSRDYRGRKYDDYKYDSRYRNDNRSRRGYDKETEGVRTRYSSRERSDLRDRLRHTKSDVEERTSKSGSYKSNRYDNHRLKETAANVAEDKRPHKSGKATVETDSRVSSSRMVVNTTTVNHNVEKNTEQHSVKNESPRASASSAENMSTGATTENRNHLEEGEILDSPDVSPEKKNNSTKNFTTQAMGENVAKVSIQMEDTNGNAPVSIEENVESASRCVEDDLTQLNPIGEGTSTTTDMCLQELVINNLHSDKIVTYPNFPSPGMIGSCNNNGDYECENCVDENVRDDVASHPVEEMYDFNNENIIRNEEVGNTNIEDTTEVDKVATMLGFTSLLPSNDDIRQTDHEDVASPVPDEVTQVEAVSNNCDNVDASRASNGNEISHQVPDNRDVGASRACLSDHNYVRDTATDVFPLNATSNTLERRELVPDTATSKETKAEEVVNTQSVDIKKTTLNTVKSKKDQKSKAVVISRRRRVVTLSDNSASMTILINTDSTGSSLVDNSASDKSDTVLKPRACKLARTIKPPCK